MMKLADMAGSNPVVERHWSSNLPGHTNYLQERIVMAKQYLYMLGPHDNYELPLYVCDTIQELSAYVGLKPNHVSSAISKAKKVHGFCKYVRVEIGRSRKKCKVSQKKKPLKSID